jgi:hypothetical protein
MFRPPYRLVVPLLAILLAAGCAKSPRSFLSPQASTSVRSTLSLASAGEGRYTATFRAADPGARVQYAIDPPADGEIAWKDAPPGALSLRLERRNAPYVLLARSVGPTGPSTPERFVFSENVIYKVTLILSPRPTHQQPIPVPPTFDVNWQQVTVDVPQATAAPTFLTRLVTASDINPANPLGITQEIVTAFFRDQLANHRADWTATTETKQRLENQEVLVVKYFAVVALDANGAPEPSDTLFSLDANVLGFRATNESLGPDMLVQNELFNVRKFTSSLDATPRAEITLRAGTTTTVNWQAVPDVGRQIDGFRWAVDLESLSDESPRKNAKDLAHWSDWSLVTTSATIGPFPAGDANKAPHLFYVEARDNLGGINLVAVSIRVSARPKAQAPLLVIDDLYGTPTQRTDRGTFLIAGVYPMEAEQDSFYNAVGGVPDSLRRFASAAPDPTALSAAGAFAGFPYDTLDYRFWPRDVPFETLNQYRVVAWYSDPASAARVGDKFSTTPMTALRRINSAQQVNSLAEYVAAGGKVWLFGAGATRAIANGYWTRIGGGQAPLPYTTGDERDDILVPGNFLYDFVHLRSTVNGVATPAQPTIPSQLKGCIPYLPQFAGPASQVDRTHDPRIGPSSARTAENWSDLPRLTIAAYRGASADPDARSIAIHLFIADPLELIEGRRPVSTADTLYLAQARTYDPNGISNVPSDGKPNAIWYHGGDQGDVVWFGFPLEFFELDQARQVVRAVMRNFGIEPLPAGVREGPGAAQPPAGTEEATPVAQRVR